MENDSKKPAGFIFAQCFVVWRVSFKQTLTIMCMHLQVKALLLSVSCVDDAAVIRADKNVYLR